MTYLIRRFCADDEHPDHRRVITRGLSLEQAQAHCSRDETHEASPSGEVVWFDGYEDEGTEHDDDS